MFQAKGTVSTGRRGGRQVPEMVRRPAQPKPKVLGVNVEGEGAAGRQIPDFMVVVSLTLLSMGGVQEQPGPAGSLLPLSVSRDQTEGGKAKARRPVR